VALFIGIHKLSRGAKEKQMKDGWKNYRKACKKMGLKPISVSYSTKKRIAWCQTEAKSQSEVRKAHQNVSIPLADVIEAKTLR